MMRHFYAASFFRKRIGTYLQRHHGAVGIAGFVLAMLSVWKKPGDLNRKPPAMAASSTARSRHCRARKRAGLVRLVVEVDEDRLCDWLTAGEDPVLSPMDADRHDKVEQALERALTLLISNYQS
jgi:hypothetical protein